MKSSGCGVPAQPGLEEDPVLSLHWEPVPGLGRRGSPLYWHRQGTRHMPPNCLRDPHAFSLTPQESSHPTRASGAPVMCQEPKGP